MNDELERLWIEEVVLKSEHLPGGAKKNYKNLGSNIRSSDRHLNQAPPG
jgi:hypothetical protein